MLPKLTTIALDPLTCLVAFVQVLANTCATARLRRQNITILEQSRLVPGIVTRL